MRDGERGIMRDGDQVSIDKGDVDGCNMAYIGINRDSECSLVARLCKTWSNHNGGRIKIWTKHECYQNSISMLRYSHEYHILLRLGKCITPKCQLST